MNNNSAGKGDKPRPVVKRNYDENFDKIRWVQTSLKEQKTKKNKTTYIYK